MKKEMNQEKINSKVLNSRIQMNFITKMLICFSILLISILMQNKVSYAASDKLYLSDIPYVTEKTTVSSGHSVKLDKNDSDKMLTINVEGKEKIFIKGLCAWASSEVVYDLNGYDYDNFTAYVGVDVSEKNDYFNTGVKFIIYTSNDAKTWEQRYESKTLDAWKDAEYVNINIKNARYLKLVADKNSPNWWAEWYDEAIYADAKLTKEGYVEDNNVTVDFIKTVEQYDELLKTYEQARETEVSRIAISKSEEYEHILLQREFVNRVGYDILQAFVRCNDDYKETVRWLITDVNNLRLYILGGEPDGNYISSLQALTKLYMAHKDDLEIKTKTDHGTVYGELYRKMMITLSLTHSAQVALWMDTTSPENQSDPVTRYEIFKDLHKNGKFVVSDKQDHTPWFEDLKVEEMRFVLNNIIDDEEILWLNEYTQEYINKNPGKEEEYLQPHHYMKYIWPDYSRPEYHDMSKMYEWDQKYNFLKYNVTYRPGVVKLWMNIEGGAVCGGISKIGSNIRGVHGTPSSVISQPGHAALIYYRKDKDGNGYWTIDNDVSGWAQSGKTERLSLRMPLGWGSDDYVEGWAASYIVLAQEALNHYEDYEKSAELIMLANTYEGNPSKQEALYREALGIQSINIDAWYGLIKLYKADETKQEEDYYNLAKEIGENLKAFPLPMYNLTNLLAEEMKTDEYTFKFTILQTKILTDGINLEDGSKLVYQPSITRTVANYLLGQMDKDLATFSLDGENANKIMLSERYASSGLTWDYSIDGKHTWNQVISTADKEHSATLTSGEISRLTAENDIYVHIYGTPYEEENLFRIDLTQQDTLPGLYANDLENRVINVKPNTEWRYVQNSEIAEVSEVADSDNEWNSYEKKEPKLRGDVSIEVRQPGTGTMLTSLPQRFDFTADNQPLRRRYVSVSHLSIEDVSTEEPGRGRGASNAIDR